MDLDKELRHRKTYLLTREVIDLLQVTRSTLCDGIRVGGLPMICVDNAYLYTPRMMAEWLTRRQTVKTPARRSA
jgi:hypothetical protein